VKAGIFSNTTPSDPGLTNAITLTLKKNGYDLSRHVLADLFIFSGLCISLCFLQKVACDQTDDNQFAQVYNPVSTTSGQQGVVPGTLYNPDLHWEKTYTTELGLELGFLHDKLVFSMTGYRSRSRDQILTSSIAGQAGGAGVVTNMPSVEVQNEALELSLRTSNQPLGPVQWTSTVNLTLARNKLMSFPGQASTSYASTLEVCKSLTVSRGFHYTGVDPKSGLYQFQDVNKDEKLDARDVLASPSRDPRYYGSWANSFSYKGWRLDVVATFCAQNGDNPLVILARQNPPGMRAPSELSNGPVEWLDHWRKPGDRALQQRLTAGQDQAAVTALGNYLRVGRQYHRRLVPAGEDPGAKLPGRGEGPAPFAADEPAILSPGAGPVDLYSLPGVGSRDAEPPGVASCEDLGDGLQP